MALPAGGKGWPLLYTERSQHNGAALPYGSLLLAHTAEVLGFHMATEVAVVVTRQAPSAAGPGQFIGLARRVGGQLKHSEARRRAAEISGIAPLSTRGLADHFSSLR